MQTTPLAEAISQAIIDAEHREIINKIAQKYTRGTSICWEDATQTASLKVLEAVKAGKFHQGGIKEFQRWATVVARYEILNFVQKERLRNCQSLDATIAGTDLSLVETIADELNLLDTVTRADLIIKVREAITNLDSRYPERGYLKIWQGMVALKKQTQLALELDITQGEISKRWKELVGRVAMELGLLQPEAVKHEQQNSKLKDTRKRCKAKW